MKNTSLRLLRAALVAGLCAGAWLNQAHALETSARDIMEKNFYVSKTKSLKSDAIMVLINDKQQTRQRKTTTISKLQENGIDSSLLVKFLAPADVKGTGFLQIEHSAGDDDIWVYLPALKKSRRLVANNKKDSFFGSDFSYGDILLPRVDLYNHVLLRSEVAGGQNCYVIESTPKTETVKLESGYSKKITWIRHDNFVENKVEYYDVSGRLLKTQSTGNHRLVEQEPPRWVVQHREIINHQTDHKTVLDFENLEPGIAIADDLFTTRYIERE